jgi:hypothetical protein
MTAETAPEREHIAHLTYTIDDDGMHAWCSGCDWRAGLGFDPTLPEVQAAHEQAHGRVSGDRRLPPPYDTLSAAERETWLVCEGIYDGALTADVRRANGGRPMTAWQDLSPEAHQALIPILVQMMPVMHGVALNPEARAEKTDG